MSNLYLFIACVSALLSGVLWFMSGFTLESDGKFTWWAYIPLIGGFLSSALSIAMAYLAGGV